MGSENEKKLRIDLRDPNHSVPDEYRRAMGTLARLRQGSFPGLQAVMNAIGDLRSLIKGTGQLEEGVIDTDLKQIEDALAELRLGLMKWADAIDMLIKSDQFFIVPVAKQTQQRVGVTINGKHRDRIPEEAVPSLLAGMMPCLRVYHRDDVTKDSLTNASISILAGGDILLSYCHNGVIVTHILRPEENGYTIKNSMVRARKEEKLR